MFQLQKRLPKWSQRFFKNGFKKKRFFCLFVCLFVCFCFLFFVFFVLFKSSKFHVVWTIPFCSNSTSMWSKYLSNNVWRDFRLPMPALATVAGKNFNGKFTTKLIFRSGILYYHCWCWHWKSIKSLHTLFDK